MAIEMVGIAVTQLALLPLSKHGWVFSVPDRQTSLSLTFVNSPGLMLAIWYEVARPQPASDSPATASITPLRMAAPNPNAPP